ncbi:MAG: glycoside hydrolase family 3 C-terminal domain-containing protein [Deltaproteobacteria bacterium]|nr:MAG: glycoside hydrolase family 3 C-terminal domain-containing protein [Deltaproteobacteria bacterium]
MKNDVSVKDLWSGEERERLVADLLSKMTLDEKVAQMSGKLQVSLLLHIFGYGKYAPFETPAIKRIGIPGIRFIDGPRGVNFKGSTAFPVSMARGATWDPQLEYKVGEAMGYEARAGGANFSGAVCMNVLRHPSWGRSQETFGEDPCHIGRMAVGMATGMQNHVMACLKHYAANSIEESRLFVDVLMEERCLREIYLPHFKMCVDAGAASVMSAYNKLNGKRCGHNRHLLTEILKEEWGFEGFVISDFFYGIRGTVEPVNAGLDIEMPIPIYLGKKLKQAVIDGKVPERAIDEAVTRIIRQKLRFSHLEKKAGYSRQRVAGPAHTALARKVAQKGIVLLKNDNSALPLNYEELKKIAVVGRLAERVNLGDRGSSSVRPPYAVTPLRGIRERAGRSISVVFDQGRNLSRASKVAREADAVIVVAGFTWRDEGEYIKEFKIGGDRIDLNLFLGDTELIEAVASVNDRCIVVLESGTAITMETWKDRVSAILMIWYPGMEGGRALADIIFGDVNPSGKLPITFPKSADQLFRFDNRAKTVIYDRYHGYRYFDKNGLEPLFPFGFGLSYTTYRYDNLRLSSETIGRDGKLEAEVNVTNTGEMSGEEIVQLYFGCKGSRVDRAVKELKGFGRVSLKPGETRSVAFEVVASDLAYYDQGNDTWVVEEIEYTIYVGPSSRQEDLLSASFRVAGT